MFPAGSLDGIFDSSVLHHVTSFGGYRHDNAERGAARRRSAQLKPDGVLVVRDFLDPGPSPVLLELPADDGDDDASDVRALLQRRAASSGSRGEFRPLSPTPGSR